MHFNKVFNLALHGIQDAQLCFRHGHRCDRVRGAEHHAAPHLLVAEFREVQGDAFASARFGGVVAVHLHPPHVPSQARRQQRQRVVDAHEAARGDTRNHRPRTPDSEHIFDPDPKHAGAGPVLAGRHDLVERVKEALEAFTCDIRDRANGRVCQERPREQTA